MALVLEGGLLHWKDVNLPNIAELDRYAEGCIYVLRLDTGEFKIGRTVNVRSRIGSLRTALSRHHTPRFIVDGWYSREHAAFVRTEAQLIAYCVETFGGPTFGAEIFAGDYDRAVAHAERLTASGGTQ